MDPFLVSVEELRMAGQWWCVMVRAEVAACRAVFVARNA